MSKYKSQFLKNAATTAFVNVLVMALNFVSIPYMLSGIGKVGFGLFTLVKVFSPDGGLLAMLEFGFTSSTAKRVGEHKGEREFWERIFYNHQFILFVVGGIASLSLFVMPDLWLKYFSSESMYDREALVSLRILSISPFFVLPGFILEGALIGFNRVDLVKRNEGISRIVNVLGIFILIYFEKGVRDLTLLLVVSMFIRFFLNLISVKKFVGISPVSLKGFRSVSMADIWTSIKFSSGFFVGKMSSILFMNAPRLLLGAMTDLKTLANYELVFKVMQFVKGIVGILSSSIQPTILDLKKESIQRAISAFYKIYKYQMFIVLPPITGMAFYSKSFYRIWLGEDYSGLSELLLVGLLWNFFIVVTDTFQITLIGLSRTLGRLPFIWIASTVFHILISGTMILLYGEFGVILSFVIIEVIRSVLFSFLMSEYFVKKATIVRYTFLSAISSLPAFLMGVTYSHYISINSELTLILALGLWEAMYLVSLYVILLDSFERREIGYYVHRVLLKLKLV